MLARRRWPWIVFLVALVVGCGGRQPPAAVGLPPEASVRESDTAAPPQRPAEASTSPPPPLVRLDQRLVERVPSTKTREAIGKLLADKGSLRDLLGRRVAWSDLSTGPVTVIAFLDTRIPPDDPLFHAMTETAATYGRRASFASLYVDALPRVDLVAAHRLASRSTWPTAIDGNRALAIQVGIEATPTFAIIDKSQRILFIGRWGERPGAKALNWAGRGGVTSALEDIVSGRGLFSVSTQVEGYSLDGKQAQRPAEGHDLDAALIFTRACVGCHRPDGPAPFALASAAEIRERADQIVEQVSLRAMPPSAIVLGERPSPRGVLSDAEVDAVIQWTRGVAKAALTSSLEIKARASAAADAVIPLKVDASPSAKRLVPVGGTKGADAFSQERWLTAAEFRLRGGLAAPLFVLPPGSGAQPDDVTNAVAVLGFSGLDGVFSAPSGAAIRIPAGSRLMTTPAAAARLSGRSHLALNWAKSPAARELRMAVFGIGAAPEPKTFRVVLGKAKGVKGVTLLGAMFLPGESSRSYILELASAKSSPLLVAPQGRERAPLVHWFDTPARFAVDAALVARSNWAPLDASDVKRGDAMLTAVIYEGPANGIRDATTEASPPRLLDDRRAMAMAASAFRLDGHAAASATLEYPDHSPNAIRVTPGPDAMGEVWSVNLSAAVANLANREQCGIEFSARADAARSIVVGLRQPDGKESAPLQEVKLVPTWQRFRTDFSLPTGEKELLATFKLGGSASAVELADIEIDSSPARDGWSIPGRNQPMIAEVASNGATSGAKVHYLAEPGGDPWALILEGLTVKVQSSKRYVVAFRGRSHQPRTLRFVLGARGPSRDNLGIAGEAALGPEWRRFRFDGIISRASEALVRFAIGGGSADFEIADLIVAPTEWGVIVQPDSGVRIEPVSPPREGPARFEPRSPRGREAWALKVFGAEFAAKAGKTVTIRFDARADSPRSVIVGAGFTVPPWTSVGPSKPVSLTTEWKPFELKFASDVDGPRSAVVFQLAGDPAPVDVRNLSVKVE